MKTILYEQTLSRTVECEVSDEDYAVLIGETRDERWEDARQSAIASALETIAREPIPIEFVCASASTLTGEELFDVG